MFSREGDIWISNANGSNQIKLTNDSNMWNDYPSCSPDGKRIVFTTESGLSIMNSDGSNPVLVDEDNSGKFIIKYSRPQWSPDSSLIAYYVNMKDGLVIIRPDGSEKRYVPINSSVAMGIAEKSNLITSWEPDSKKIRISQRDTYDYSNAAIDIDSSELFELPYRGSEPATWSPDLQKAISFSLNSFKNKSKVFLNNANGKKRELFSLRDIRHVKWSKDGNWIIGDQKNLFDEGSHIFIMNINHIWSMEAISNGNHPSFCP